MIRFIDFTFPTPEENLAFDEALLIALEKHEGSDGPDDEGEVLRFWESRVHFVVLGMARKLYEDVDVEACSRNGLPILRRATGGGTVLQGPGCLNFTLVLSLNKRPELRNVGRSYATILGSIAQVLNLEGAHLRGISDLALDGRKVSGNAQKRTRNALLHHGTILYNFDLSMISCFLHEPRRQPRYRERRSHAAFLRNIPLGVTEMKSRIATAWDAAPHSGSFLLSEFPSLVTAKYSTREWVELY